MAVEETTVNSNENNYLLLPFWKRDLILFWSFFKIAAIVVGGGYAIIAAARREFVDKQHWLNDEDVLDMITVTQTVPGIIACSSAIFIGWKVDRYRGAICSLIGAVLPSVIIILSLASIIAANKSFTDLPQVKGAFRGVIGAICGMVAATAWKMRKQVYSSIIAIIIATCAFVGLSVFRINPAFIIIAAVITGITSELIIRKQNKISPLQKEDKK